MKEEKPSDIYKRKMRELQRTEEHFESRRAAQEKRRICLTLFACIAGVKPKAQEMEENSKKQMQIRRQAFLDRLHIS